MIRSLYPTFSFENDTDNESLDVVKDSEKALGAMDFRFQWKKDS